MWPNPICLIMIVFLTLFMLLKLSIIKCKCLQFPLPSTTILYLYSTFVFLVSVIVCLFSPMLTPTVFLALKYKSFLCSRFSCQVVIFHSLQWPHSSFPFNPSCQPADTLKPSSLTMPNQKCSPSRISCQLKVQSQSYLLFSKFSKELPSFLVSAALVFIFCLISYDCVPYYKGKSHLWFGFCFCHSTDGLLVSDLNGLISAFIVSNPSGNIWHWCPASDWSIPPITLYSSQPFYFTFNLLCWLITVISPSNS